MAVATGRKYADEGEGSLLEIVESGGDSFKADKLGSND